MKYFIRFTALILFSLVLVGCFGGGAGKNVYVEIHTINADSEPVPGVGIYLNKETEPRYYTDKNGYIKIVVPTGTKITVHKDGSDFLPKQRTVNKTEIFFFQTISGYSITGKVVDNTGRGIPSVTITAEVVLEDGTKEVISLPTTTDLDGKYTLLGLYGEVQVRAEKSGFFFSGPFAIRGERERVDFNGTDDTTSLYGVSGKAVDSKGKGVPGVTITALSGEALAHIPAITDENGSFSLADLFGVVDISADKEGYSFAGPFEIRGQKDNLTFLGLDASSLTYTIAGSVRDDDGMGIPSVEIEFLLESGSRIFTHTNPDGTYTKSGFYGAVEVNAKKANYTFTNAVKVNGQAYDVDFIGSRKTNPVFQVSGIVVDGFGKGIPAVEIEILLSSGTKVRAQTGTDGRYSKGGLSGTVTVTAKHKDYVFNDPIEALDAETRDADFIGIAKTGPAVYTVQGRVMDGFGNGVPAAKISFLLESGTTVIGWTNSDGLYSKAGLSGTVKISVGKGGWDFSEPTSYTVSEAQENIDFVGNPPNAPAVYSISGKVMDNVSGQPIPAATVSFELSSNTTVRVVTGLDGTYKKSGFVGNVSVKASKTNYSFDGPFTVTSEDQVDFLGTSTVVVTYTVNGQVIDDEGRGISGAYLSFAMGGGKVLTATADGNGRFFRSGLTGIVNVTVQKTGYTFSATQIDGQNDHLNIVALSKPYTVSGMILDHKGQGLGSATLTFNVGGKSSTVLSDSNGRFTNSGLSGTGSVTVSKTSYGFPPSVSITGPSDSLNIAATSGPAPTFTVSGTVFDHNEKPLANANLTFVVGGATSYASTDAAGRYTRVGLSGTGHVNVSKTGYGFEANIAITGGSDSFNITATSGPAATYSVSGKVLDKDNKGIVGAHVEFKQGATSFFAVTTEGGAFTREDLSGSFDIIVTKANYTFPTDLKLMGQTSDLTIHALTQPATIYSVKGNVVDLKGNPINNVFVTVKDGENKLETVKTDSDGKFSIANLTGKRTISASKTGWTFTDYFVDGEKSNLIFHGKPDSSIVYEASGVITVGGSLDPIGVQVRIKYLDEQFADDVVITGANGFWKQIHVTGKIQVTPELVGYTFDPVDKILDVVNTKVDFTATKIP